MPPKRIACGPKMPNVIESLRFSKYDIAQMGIKRNQNLSSKLTTISEDASFSQIRILPVGCLSLFAQTTLRFGILRILSWRKNHTGFHVARYLYHNIRHTSPWATRTGRQSGPWFRTKRNFYIPFDAGPSWLFGLGMAPWESVITVWW